MNPPTPASPAGRAAAPPRRPAAPAAAAPLRGLQRAVRLFTIYSLIFIIALADALTPPGVVVGVLLGIPILIASFFEEKRHVLAAGLTSVICFLLAAWLSTGATAPATIRLPNRMFALLTILAVSFIALEFQRRRRQLERARAQAESARDLTHLMHSLMAHDLRAPLVLARQGFDMVRNALESGTAPNVLLIDEVDGRLTRSLRTIELVLETARGELAEPSSEVVSSAVPIAAELAEELATFQVDARVRGKTLELQVSPPDLVARVDGAVLRQSVGILIDNAIRYALPGSVLVLAQVHGDYLWVHVRDQGPGMDEARTEGGAGAGIGLRLGRLLAKRAGGSLDVMRNGSDGTEFVLRLPSGR